MSVQQPSLPVVSAVLHLFLLLLSSANCQLDFSRGQVPTFRVGVFYPGRSTNPIVAEVETCRAITDRIERNSARFNAELVTNTNNAITYTTANSRIMSSRMQSRLDDLARTYANRFGNRRLTVLKAWTPYPDPQLVNEPESLHYEGRSVRVRLSNSADYDDLLQLAVGETAFDWVYYAASNFVRLSVIPSNCVRNVDCVFLLDRSGSVGATNHGIALQFINSVVSFFNIGPQTSRVGMAAYSSSSSIQFDLDDHTTSTRLQNAVEMVRFTGGSTNTPAALDHARLLLNPGNNRGARVNSLGIPKIAILITDGRSNRGNLRAAAPALRNAGVQVYTVGIGNIDVNELRDIASDPDDEHVFILSSFLDAAGFVDFLSVTTCDTPAIIDPGDNTTTTNPDGGIKYFQTECSAFSDKILVELIDISGTSFLYCSAIETNPGPLTPNTVTNETMGITRRTGIVRFPDQQKVVYIGVQGQGQSDSFTLIVWDQLFDPVDAFIDVVEGALTGVTIYDVTNNLTAAARQGQSYDYSIIEGNENGIFAINGDTGRVFIPSTSPGLNFDTRRTHILTVQAINRQEDCQRARIRINIRVISNRIVFGALSPQVVPENTPRNTPVVRVVATGGAGLIQYSIVGGNMDGAFAINGGSGEVRVNRVPNFEDLNMYTLRVRAVSTGTMVNGETDLEIRITDVNEPHTFVTNCAIMMQCTYRLNENLPSTVLDPAVVASDPDDSSSPNGMLSYRIDNLDVPFSVNSQGQIRSSRPLDRETRDSYTFGLVVTDGCVGGCSHSIRTTIRVTVNDLNDNPPVYVLASPEVSWPEGTPSGTVVAQYRATDADIGTNAEVTYALSSSPDVFPFNFDDGILTLDGDLDFEMTQSYAITVTASNPGNVFPTPTNTVIRVTNINDNTPVFTAAPDGSVEENSAANTLVLTVQAIDADLGIHGEVRYSIVGGNFNNSFQIGGTNGQIRVRNNIDRETISSFTLVVQARDRGTPQQRSTRTNVEVTVTDVNDNPPIFQPDSYSVRIREDSIVGSNVVQVIASDADQPGNPNSQIQYIVTGGNEENRFRIDPGSGQIELMMTLDFETRSSYDLAVEARDGGTPTMTGSATVSVAVINVNENPPTLTGNQVVNISESAPVSSTVAVFQALDPDQMAVTFTIGSGNDENRFEIGTSSGEITLRAMLDYETTTQYAIQITASDGQQSTSALLTVIVLDENEFAPVFFGDTAFTIVEEQPNAVADVGRVMARDDDRDAVVSYSFTTQDRTTNLFNLDSQSGMITTRSSLDREVLTQVFVPPSSVATVMIAASDNGSPPMRSIQAYTITLQDINDNTPVFSDDSYVNSLPENLPPNQAQPVFEATATDADLGINADITYSFTLAENLGNTNPFSIDPAMGTIRITSPLDCELQSSYNFTITARDGGTPSLSATVTGMLTVQDENDNAPIFEFPTYHRTISEDAPAEEVVLTVLATDRDKGVNGEVRYRIMTDSNGFFNFESSQLITQFIINPDNGDISNLNEFDFESASQINLTVFADDGGVPQLSNTTLVILDVVNVDETSPIFISSSCDVSVPEDISVGDFVTQCLARDIDSTAAANQPQIMYSFNSPNEFFEIGPVDGEIRTRSLLDRESQGGHTATIVAMDTGGRSTTQRLVVRLSDVNDNAPTFMNTPYRFQFTGSNMGSARELLTVSARDGDNGVNRTFSLSVGTTERISDTETRVTIVATDSGSPQQSSSEPVIVTFEQPCQLQEYSINADGVLSASLLCSVEISPLSLPLVIGGEKTVTCRIVSNTAVSYQWLHNSTTVTNQAIVEGGANVEVSFMVTDAQFSDAGEYACRVTSSAGSLQTIGATATIQVSPTITTPPENAATALGSTATFTCNGVGIPTPTTQWFRGDEMVGETDMLVLTDVDSDAAGTYMCMVTNEAGSSTASAELVTFDAFNVVELDLGGISAPSMDGSCQHFNREMLEAALADVTRQTAIVTGIQGGDEQLCEESACSPSPCRNGGECSLNQNVLGGFECACRPGFTGVDCTEDVFECDEDPCGGQGECTDTLGSFLCTCNANYTGRRCQLRSVCNEMPCSEGESCVETFTGFECITPDKEMSLVVEGPFDEMNIGELNDLVQLFIQEELALLNSRRRKRQVVRLDTICEPRFILATDGSNQYLLIWLCPNGEDTPSSKAQQRLCDYLFQYGGVASCKLPLGEFMTPPTLPPLPSIDVMVTIIMIDSDTNKPIDALDSIALLEENNAEQQLSRSTGLEVSEIMAQESEPRPQGESSVSGGAVAGGVIAVLLVVGLLVVAGVAIAVIKLRKDRSRQESKKARALQMITMEGGRTVIGRSDTVKSTASTDNLLTADGSPMVPRRPPKPSPSPSMELNDDSIYQNVTTAKAETITSSPSVSPSKPASAPETTDATDDAGDYDMLPEKKYLAAPADDDADDYDNLPPKKNVH